MYVSLYSKQEYENKCYINLQKVFDIKKDYKVHKTLFIKIEYGIHWIGQYNPMQPRIWLNK